MLKRTKTEFEPYSSSYDANPAAPSTESDTPGTERTVIGEHISIDGSIRAQEDLIIQGTLKGSLELDKHHAFIGSKGKVEADVHAENVTISGKVNGNIFALGKVALTKEAQFTGQIKAKRIAIEDGAFVKASIEMVRDDDDKNRKPADKHPIDAVVIEKKDVVKPPVAGQPFAGR
jgi:cytoskeletal protein CcmA (bactofilin family)